MPYPERPLIPNPYQIAGQAAQEFGGEVKKFGEGQDALQERFRLMMEKRAEAELKKQQTASDLDFKNKEETRKQTEFEGKEKSRKEKSEFLTSFQGADPTDPATNARLKQALVSGIIDAAEYKALQPKDPERFSAGGGYYEMGPDNKPKVLVAPKPETPAKPRLQQVTLDDGSLAILNLENGTYQPVNAPDGTPVKGGTKDQGGKIFQQENTLRDEFNKKTVPFETARTAYDKMYGAIQSNNSADAYAAVIDFVKTLDPGSTVREGEYMTAKSAGAGGSYGKLKQAIRNMYDGKMTPEVRKNLLEAGQNLMAAEQASYDRVRKDYKNRVENYNQRGVNLDTTAVLSTYPEIQGLTGGATPETKVWKGVTYVLKPGTNRKDPNSWTPQR